jgi:hypothetical protein
VAGAPREATHFLDSIRVPFIHGHAHFEVFFEEERYSSRFSTILDGSLVFISGRCYVFMEYGDY